MLLQERNRTYRIWFYVFWGSFFVGILLMNFCSDYFLNENGIFGSASLNRIQYLEVDNGSFFQYVLRQRLKPAFLMGILSTTCFGIAATYLCIVWQGVLIGMMITAAMIRFGTKGILLILAGLFPQQLLLVPAYIMLLCWCYQNCCFLYYPRKCSWPSYRNKKKQYLHQAVTLLWIAGVLIIGCVLEGYVNPILLSDMVKIF